MTSHARHITAWPKSLFISAILFALAFAFVLPSSALAQDKAKWKVAIIDATSKTKSSKSIRKKFTNLLKESPRVKLVETSDFPDLVGMERRKFSVASRLKKKRTEIAKEMKEEGLEAIIVMDMISKGRRVRIISIGPDGKVAFNEKTKLKKRRRIKESVAKRLLSEALTPVAPLIAEARAGGGAVAQKEPDKPAVGAVDETDEFGDVKESTDTDGFDESEDTGMAEGPFTGQTRVSVGPFLGLRTSSTTTSDVFLEQRNPLVGAGGQFSFGLGLMKQKLQFGIDADLLWAPFSSTLSADAAGNSLEVGGNYLRGGGVLRLTYAITNIFFVGLRGGVDALSVTLEENATYTGHRYIWAKTGLEVGLQPTESFTVWFHAHALPLLSAENSGNAYGEGGSSLGLEAGAQINASLTDSIGIDLLYKLTSAETEFDTPPEGQTQTPVSEEFIHQVLVMAGVRF